VGIALVISMAGFGLWRLYSITLSLSPAKLSRYLTPTHIYIHPVIKAGNGVVF